MKKLLVTSVTLILLSINSMVSAAPQTNAPALIDPLALLEPYTNRTWQHTVGTKGEPGYFNDISHWQTVMGGHAVLTRHSVNEGVYGGYTLIFYDAEASILRCTYVTNGGFYTECTIRQADDQIIVEETVKGTRRGPESVRSQIAIEDGQMIVTSQYKTEKDWSDPEVRRYHENPTALVIFN
ncbi:hypothetical protein GCM10017044_11930 [Kordiimonas sediminis]|uniref:DUF1579 domain-containing protein n=1 Tax=Kordiimonas sediminis TaxID=1735581 RepID=A0A919AQU7_9PROT|nr:hypothetical protein [Kordiimonas sediminis]GHF18990.1 hypothetical protein GCM10017044_11930 [Kordiimonas sediminis]